MNSRVFISDLILQVYDQSFEAILNDLGLDARGVAASEGWEVDGALLRSSIRRLRGICTHPQVRPSWLFKCFVIETRL